MQGRWISPDPAGLGAVDPGNPQTWNRYAYVNNNPLSYTDPLGLSHGSPGGGSCDQCDQYFIPMIEGSGWFGNCTVDGALSNCGQLGGNGMAACPNNVCDGFTKSGDYFQFVAGAGGASGYVRFSDITQGMYEANGTFMSGAQYNAYVQSTFGAQIDAQRRALAQAIAANSNGTISYQQAYDSLNKDNGHLQGGNYNFGETTYGPGDLGCGADASRCNGIHFPDAGFVHLDTSNPFTGPLVFLEHGFVDLFLGNIAYTVIPRPWP